MADDMCPWRGKGDKWIRKSLNSQNKILISGVIQKLEIFYPSVFMYFTQY